MRLERAGNLEGAAIDRATALNLAFEGADPREVLAGALAEFPGEIAMVSSFGADSVVLLHMVSRIDRGVPVLMIDTLMLFRETLEYQARVAARLGLNVLQLRPTAADLAAGDPDGDLHLTDTDACCEVRKVVPLERVEGRWPVTVTGRKRFQGSTRAALRSTPRRSACRPRTPSGAPGRCRRSRSTSCCPTASTSPTPPPTGPGRGRS